MGLDAESQDLTARIQAKRRALVLAGEVDPHKPGERVIHGRQPGAADNLEGVGVGRSAQAAEARGRRSFRGSAEAAGVVVEMDYTDYTGTQPGTREAADADEPFEVGDEAEAEAEDEFDLGEELVEKDYGPKLETFDPSVVEGLDTEALEALIAAVARDMHEQHAEVLERLDGLARGLVVLAEHMGQGFERLDFPRYIVEPAQKPEPVESPGFWKRLFG